MYKVGIIGLGFVGTAVETGLQSVAEIKIYDKYKPSDSLEDVVDSSDILFICLPTPMDPDTGECKTSIIESEIDNIVQIAEKRKTIVIKSTVPPGTTSRLNLKYDYKHFFVFNPEFLREKTFIEDFLNQDRIILGFEHRRNYDTKLENLYEAFIKTQKNPAKIIVCTSTTAEMAKYIGNCFLATKVMFFNEIHEICKAAGIDYEAVSALSTMDPRIGSSHIKVPGDKGLYGFGGSCFPKDMNALIFSAKQYDLDPMILDSVWTQNLLLRQEYDWETLAQVTGEYDKDE